MLIEIMKWTIIVGCMKFIEIGSVCLIPCLPKMKQLHEITPQTKPWSFVGSIHLWPIYIYIGWMSHHFLFGKMVKYPLNPNKWCDLSPIVN